MGTLSLPLPPWLGHTWNKVAIQILHEILWNFHVFCENFRGNSEISWNEICEICSFPKYYTVKYIFCTKFFKTKLYETLWSIFHGVIQICNRLCGISDIIEFVKMFFATPRCHLPHRDATQWCKWLHGKVTLQCKLHREVTPPWCTGVHHQVATWQFKLPGGDFWFFF